MAIPGYAGIYFVYISLMRIRICIHILVDYSKVLQINHIAVYVSFYLDSEYFNDLKYKFKFHHGL